MTHALQTTTGSRRSMWILLATALGAVDGIDTAGIVVANPAIARDLHTDLAALQWITNGFLLAMAVCVLGAGRIGDRIGHKRAFLGGLIGFGVMSAMVGTAQSVEPMIAYRVIQGAFGAVLVPSALALLRLTYPPDRLKAAVGVWAGMFSGATALTPYLAGFVVDNFGWRWMFFLKLAISAVAFGIAAWAVPSGRAETFPRTLDLPGSLLLGGALGGLVWGIMQLPTAGWTGLSTLVGFGISIVSFAVFGWHANRATEPLLPLRLFRSAPLSAGTGIVLLMGTASFGAIFYVAIYLQQVLGLTASNAGLTLVSVTALFVVSAPISGVLNRRYGPRVPIIAGLVLNGSALVGLAQVTPQSSVNMIWPLLLLFGFGLGFVMPTATECIISNAPEKLAGVAGGLQHTAGMLGTALGTAIFGSVISWRIATTLNVTPAGADVPADTTREAIAFTSGLRLAVLVALGIVVLAIPIALLTQRSRAVETVEPDPLYVVPVPDVASNH